MRLLYLNSDKIGDVNSELGEKLLITFLNKVLSQQIEIDVIFCVNSGALLTSTNNNAVEILKKFEKKGTIISTCGTCLDFYNIREQLKVGDIGSMDLLVKLMSQAENILRP